jgi:site-specific recombinase XerC
VRSEEDQKERRNGMDNLARVIGLAPSEMTLEDFLARLKRERKRVSETLQRFKEEPKKSLKVPVAKKVGEKKEIRAAGVTKLMQEHGVTEADLAKYAKMFKEQQGEG